MNAQTILLISFLLAPGALAQQESGPLPLPLPAYIAEGDEGYYESLTPEQRVMAAVRRDLFDTHERIELKRRIDHHARLASDHPIPTSMEDLSDAQRQVVEGWHSGSLPYEPMSGFHGEIAALYASKIYRDSPAFRRWSDEAIAQSIAGRGEVDRLSKEQRRRHSGRGWYGSGGSGRGGGIIALIAGLIVGLIAFLKKRR